MIARIHGVPQNTKAGRSRALLVSALAAPLVLAAGVASAQTAPAPAAGTTPTTDQNGAAEVVVTAQFRAQNLQKTPLAITALNAKILEARGQENVDQVANEAPNVTLKPGPEPFGPAMQTFIRGIGQADFEPTFSPGVGMYVDDVYFGTITGTDFKLLDLDRVEVLRGPQGTLAGQNSIGGSIKLYTKKPDGSDGGFFSVGYGSYNQVELKGAADFTVVPDQLFVRISGYSDQQQGYVTRYDYGCTHPGSGVPSQVTGPNCKLGTEGGTSTGAGRLAIRWTPTAKLEVNVSADYTADNSEASPLTLLYVGSTAGNGCPVTAAGIACFPGIGAPENKAFAGPVPFGTPSGSAFVTTSPFEPSLDTFTHSPYTSYANFCDANPDNGGAGFCLPAIQHYTDEGLAGTIDYQLTDHIHFKSITAYRRLTSDWTIDQSPAPVNNDLLDNMTIHRQWSEEARLTGDAMDSTVHWTVGGFYFDEKSEYNGLIDLDILDFLEADTVPAHTEAGFANVDWNVTDKLELSGGLRYTDQYKEFIFGRLGVPGAIPFHFGNLAYIPGISPGVPYVPCNLPASAVPISAALCGLNGLTNVFKGSHLDYRAAAQYQWTPDFMTYASVATGFKGGGISARPFFPDQALPFGPEVDTTYEVGLKSQWFDRMLRFNADFFYSQYDKMQLGTFTCPALGNPCFLTLNAGNSTLYGIELEGEAHPTEALEIDASLSTLNFKFDCGSLVAAALASGITCSTQEPFAPKFKYNIGAQYAFGVGSSWGTITPRLDLSYQASFFTEIPNDRFNDVAGYTLLNGSLIWRDAMHKWQIGLQVNNITNKLYYLGVFDDTTGGGDVLAEPAAPREWELTVKRDF
jgi:iron complex outermembrane receptor protein